MEISKWILLVGILTVVGECYGEDVVFVEDDRGAKQVSNGPEVGEKTHGVEERTTNMLPDKGDRRIEEDSTNPPFPSQSSSFWEVDDPRDYGEHLVVETETTDDMEPELVTRADEEDEEEGKIEDDKMEEEKIEEPIREDESKRKRDGDSRPNLILIITDDQDIELGSMDYMPETLKVFKDEGVEFRHGYVSTPICCPSRSSMLTGLYVHNHEVFTNNDNCSSINWREKYEKKTFAAHLWSSGYYTSYIGKYLNKYDGSHIPYGWDEWNGLLMNSRYYNYTLNRNGKRFRYGHDLEHDYYPDSIAHDGLDFLKRVSEDPTKRPFLLVLSFPSPHGPEDSAPRYSNMFLNATPHHTPSYNFAPNSDKQWILRITDKMNPTLKEFTNMLMTKRLQTLQSVDTSMRDLFRQLDSAQLRDSTYALYTSDHGYHVGQFGLVKGKSMPYEFDIRVPFFMTGPRSMIDVGSTIREPVLNIDIAPTFLDLANIPIPDDMDGRSMVPLLKKYCPNCEKEENLHWPDVFLIESPGRRNPPPTEESSGESLSEKHGRKGKRRNREKVVVDEDEVLSLKHLCNLHPHPCMPGQKKFCRKEKNRIRFRKCRQNIDFLVNNRMFGKDSRFNDPVYRHNHSLPESGQKCSCRFKRSAVGNEQEDLNWETEKRRIDDEIEKLKQRIEYLRQRRKDLRRKWIADNYPKETLPAGATSGRGREERKQKYGNQTVDDIGPEEDYETGSNESDEVGREEKDEEGVAEDDKRPVVTADVPVYDPVEDIQIVNFSTERTIDPQIEEGDEIEPAAPEEEEVIPEVVSIKETTKKPSVQPRGKHRNSHNRNKMKGIYLLNKNPSSPSEAEDGECSCYNDPKWLRQKEREDRKHRKLLSKLRKKQRLFQRIGDPIEREQAETCDKTGKEEKMNCFWHDSDHWRTQPLWTSGSFCFCMNANNNSYSCLRSVNTTHNYLYCQFITGFKMYFDLTNDPYQLKNAIDTLPASSEDWIMARLYKLKQCKGREDCWSDDIGSEDAIHPSLWEQLFGRWPKKRKRGGRRRKYQGTR